MNKISRLIFGLGLLAVFTSCFALPPCKGTNFSKWNNCFGRQTFQNGDTYVGEYQDGKLSGQGTFNWLGDSQWKGDKYVGEFKGGDFNGQGTYTWAKGEKYVGEYKDDKATGQGTFFWANGERYIGEFEDGKLSGRGIYYLADGSISKSGIWKDDELVTSQYVNPNSFTRIAKGTNAISDAEFQRLENERKAVQLDEERNRIEEEKRQIALERQRMESQKGKRLSPCQGADVSQWNNCFGTYIWPDGDKYVGDWKDGNATGQGSYIETNGNIYVGEFLEGKQNGRGTITFPSGANYAGQYQNGKRTGQGAYTYASGDKYIGEFIDGNYNGRGILYSSDGSIRQSGVWKDDKLVSSQYVDPNSFTRIAKGNSAPSAAESQRLENQRKAAQLEEERRKFEEEKRQAALERQRTESQKVQTQVAPDNRRRLALVIGNDNYSSMPVLNNAVNDAKSMSDALKQANFEVLYYKNLNKRGMEEALYTFAQKLGKDDVGMFYFAGHGVQANSQNFLIPVAENVKKSANVQFEGIDVNRVMAYLRDSRNSLNIVVLDACRSSMPERGGMSRGLTVTEAPQGSIVAYATSPGKAASDGDGGNSPFTKNLIRVMQRKGVKIEDVFKEVRVAVSRETNGEQVPQEVSQLVGDFYFRP